MGLPPGRFGLAARLWPSLACLAVAGPTDTVSAMTRGALVQLETPDGFRGRISAIDRVIGVTGPQLGNRRGDVLGALVGTQAALAIDGLTATAVVLAVGVANRPIRDYVRLLSSAVERERIASAQRRSAYGYDPDGVHQHALAALIHDVQTRRRRRAGSLAFDAYRNRDDSSDTCTGLTRCRACWRAAHLLRTRNEPCNVEKTTMHQAGVFAYSSWQVAHIGFDS